MLRRCCLLTVATAFLILTISTMSVSSLGPTVAALGIAEQQAPTAEQALRRLKEGNARFAGDKPEHMDLTAKRRQDLSKGQNPFAVVLTCADSRVTPEFIFDQGMGHLFVVRVAGNIADPCVLGSIEYAVEHLHVPLIVLLGHEKCGAVEAALGDEKPAGNLGKLIREVEVGTDLPAGRDAALAAAVKNNVRHQARLLTQRSDVIKTHLEQKKVRIAAGVYRLAAGDVEWFDDE